MNKALIARTLCILSLICGPIFADRVIFEPLIPMGDDGPSSVDMVISNPSEEAQTIEMNLSGGRGQDSTIGFSSATNKLECTPDEEVITVAKKGKGTKKVKGGAGGGNGVGSSTHTGHNCKMVGERYLINPGSSFSITGINFEISGMNGNSELTDYAGGYISIKVIGDAGFLIGRLIFNDQDKVSSNSTGMNFNRRGRFKGVSSSRGAMNVIRSIVVPINNGRPF